MNEQKPPLVLANRVIRMFADHMLGPDMVVLPVDYSAMRTVFRWCNGSWEQVLQGNHVHVNLLSRIVASWGKMPTRIRNKNA